MIKRLIALTIVIVLTLIYIAWPAVLAYAGVGEEPTFLGFSDNPRDISNFVDDLKDNGNFTVRTVVTTPTVFEQNMVDPENTLYIAAGIEKQYTPTEIKAIQEYVKAGGHAIIADDFGYIQALAARFNITYYTGQFYDQKFDKNVAFPICEAVLGVDEGRWEFDENIEPNRAGQKKVWNSDERDGYWDDDDDLDGIVDEDTLDRIDNDQDNRKLSKNNHDNDYDGIVDESNEGIDEDTLDDDGDWIDEYPYNNIQDPYEIGVNEERLNKKNDDAIVYLFSLDIFMPDPGEIPEKLRERFERAGIELPNGALITMGETPREDEKYINYGSWKFFIKRVEDEKIEIYKLDERVDEDMFHYQLIMNRPVALYSIKTMTNVIARGSENSYVDLNNNGEIELPDEGNSDQLADWVSTAANRAELIVEVIDPKFVGKGSIVFISDADLFTNDLYSLDHMSINYDSNTHELFKEKDLRPSPKDVQDVDDVADNTPDNRTDYDNRIFMQDLIFYLFYDTMEPGEEADILVLIDDSRHEEDAVWLGPTYSTLKVTSVMTSQYCYIGFGALFLFLGLTFTVLLSGGQEQWVHEFNVRTFKRRGTLPRSNDLKKARLRRAVLEKVRMDRGLSPEEFREVDPRDIDRLIGNPQLIQLVRDDKTSYSEEEIKRLVEIINKWKK